MKKLFKRVTAMFLVAVVALSPITVSAETTEHLALTRQMAVAHATELMEMLSIAGLTIAVVDVDNDFTWFQGLGYADAENQIPVTEHTLFNIASTSKIFTAIAIMQLVEAGLLDLDEPIVTYLPEFYVRTHPVHGGDYRNITTRMLLTHTSGITEFVGDSIFAFDGINRYAMNNLVPNLRNFHMQNEETNRITYNNTGYILLGVLVASITNSANYYDGFVRFTQDNIFTPAGMDSSSFDIHSVDRAAVALSHSDAATPMDLFHYVGGASAGSMISNAYDMARFMHIMLSGGGDIISPETVQQMVQVQDFGIQFPSEFQMGLGIMHMHRADGIITTGHGGNLLHHTEFLLDFDNGIGVYVSTNGITGGGVVASLANLILRVAVEEKTGVALQPTAFPIVQPVTDVQQLTGWYNITGAGAVQLVLCDEDSLHFMNLLGIPSITLTPVGDGTFESMIGNIWFRNVDGIMFALSGAQLLAERVEVTPVSGNDLMIGQIYITGDDGSLTHLGWTTVNEEGILYFTDGNMVILWDKIDDVTYFAPGRTRTFGNIAEYTIKDDGTMIGSENGITFIFIPSDQALDTNVSDAPETVTSEIETSIPSLPRD